jgi:serine/threonine protein kinase
VLVAEAIVGPYRVLKEIGQGGMGTVYLGEHTLLGRTVAIKVLRPVLSTDAEMVQRFFNEARALTRIADPGIVQVFDFGHHVDGNAFIVMELLDGESIDKRLKRVGRFGPIECLRLMRLICTSLRAAHAKGVIHRDLKPENIFIVDDPAIPGGERTKILDFGLAKLTGDEPGEHTTRADVLMGTPRYMSPEQCRGGGALDHRSDIYSIGCVMFTMLTGRPPFNATGAGDVIVAHLNDRPPLASSCAPDLPAAIDELIATCLQKSPAKRFQSMTELVCALDTAGCALHGWSSVISAIESSNIPADTIIDHPMVPDAPERTPASLAVHRPEIDTKPLDSVDDVRSRGRVRRRKRLMWSAGLAAGAVSFVVALAFGLQTGSGASPQAPGPLTSVESPPAVVEPARSTTSPAVNAPDHARTVKLADEPHPPSPARPKLRRNPQRQPRGGVEHDSSAA